MEDEMVSLSLHLNNLLRTSFSSTLRVRGEPKESNRKDEMMKPFLHLRNTQRIPLVACPSGSFFACGEVCHESGSLCLFCNLLIPRHALVVL